MMARISSRRDRRADRRSARQRAVAEGYKARPRPTIAPVRSERPAREPSRGTFAVARANREHNARMAQVEARQEKRGAAVVRPAREVPVDRPVKERARCKPRPKRNAGDGRGRPFVPWCK